MWVELSDFIFRFFFLGKSIHFSCWKEVHFASCSLWMLLSITHYLNPIWIHHLSKFLECFNVSSIWRIVGDNEVPQFYCLNVILEHKPFCKYWTKYATGLLLVYCFNIFLQYPLLMPHFLMWLFLEEHYTLSVSFICFRIASDAFLSHLNASVVHFTALQTWISYCVLYVHM